MNESLGWKTVQRLTGEKLVTIFNPFTDETPFNLLDKNAGEKTGESPMNLFHHSPINCYCSEFLQYFPHYSNTYEGKTAFIPLS